MYLIYNILKTTNAQSRIINGMQIVDSLVGLLAPQSCFGCRKEGYVLCKDCIMLYHEPTQSRCAGCKLLSENYKICNKCRTRLPLKSIYVAGNYEGINETLVKSLKFKFQRQAAESMSDIIAPLLTGISKETIICPIPTAPSRVRQRGFDHALLISKNIAKKLSLPHQKLLSRHSNIRQLGASRKDRFDHMLNEFGIVKNKRIEGFSVLLVDDVMTTGATLAAAAKTLKHAGAKSVSAVVFAQKD